MNFDYLAVLNMPVYERKIYIDMWQKEMEEEQIRKQEEQKKAEKKEKDQLM